MIQNQVRAKVDFSYFMTVWVGIREAAKEG